MANERVDGSLNFGKDRGRGSLLKQEYLDGFDEFGNEMGVEVPKFDLNQWDDEYEAGVEEHLDSQIDFLKQCAQAWLHGNSDVMEQMRREYVDLFGVETWGENELGYFDGFQRSFYVLGDELVLSAFHQGRIGKQVLFSRRDDSEREEDLEFEAVYEEVFEADFLSLVDVQGRRYWIEVDKDDWMDSAGFLVEGRSHRLYLDDLGEDMPPISPWFRSDMNSITVFTNFVRGRELAYELREHGKLENIKMQFDDVKRYGEDFELVSRDVRARSTDMNSEGGFEDVRISVHSSQELIRLVREVSFDEAGFDRKEFVDFVAVSDLELSELVNIGKESNTKDYLSEVVVKVVVFLDDEDQINKVLVDYDGRKDLEAVDASGEMLWVDDVQFKSSMEHLARIESGQRGSSEGESRGMSVDELLLVLAMFDLYLRDEELGGDDEMKLYKVRLDEEGSCLWLEFDEDLNLRDYYSDRILND